jgi:uncharacterized protein YkwD
MSVITNFALLNLFMWLMTALAPTVLLSLQPVNLQSEKEAILLATNQQRARKRLSVLKPDPKLMQAAQQYAEMMALQDQMSHNLNGLSLPDKAQKVGYLYRQISENIALNSRLDGRSVVIDQWMESKGHRKNLMTKDITDIGIGVAGPSKRKLYYYCQLFGAQR